MADVTARMLALLSTLQTGRSFSGDELTRRLGVSPRTLRRDVDRLRGYGYPVDTQPGPGGYYRLAAGRTMPPLVLDDDEAVATLLALAALAAASPAPVPAEQSEPQDEPSRHKSPSQDEPTASRDGATASRDEPTASRDEPTASRGEATAPGIDDAATRAYGKLDQFLPGRLRARAVSVRASLETTPQPAPSVPAEQLGLIAEAIAHKETISFDYQNARGVRARRRVDPYRQIHHLLRWYLLAWDLDRDDWRVFRLDRMTDLLRTGAPYEPRPLPADTATDYLRQALNRHKETVTLVVEAPAADVMDALRYQDAEIQSLDAHRTTVTLALDSWQWLILNLAFLNADFHITTNTAFTTACQTFAHRLLTATTPTS